MSSIFSVFENILRDVPPETYVWRPMSGYVSAEQMIKEIREESDLAKEYISEALSISRDLIIRQANRNRK